MKKLLLTLIPFTLVLLLLNSCTKRMEFESNVYLDPNFVGDTLLIDLDDSNKYSSYCFYENNYVMVDASFFEPMADSFLWSDGSQGSFIIVDQAGLIDFSAILNGTTDFQTFVDLSYCPVTLFIPNSFTPNNDQVNDTWNPEGEGLSFITCLVLDLDGTVLFSGESLSDSWDGTYKGEVVPAGSYLYEVEGGYLNGELFRHTGLVEVFK